MTDKRSGPARNAKAVARDDRRAAALRANLVRRKAQHRARKEEDRGDESDGTHGD